MFNPVVLLIYEQLRLAVNAVIGIQFFLKLDDRFVSFVEPARKCDHDISLFKEELLVPIYLLFVFFDLDPFLLDLLHLLVVLLPDDPLLLLERIAELRCVFNLFTANQHLGIHGEYLLLQQLLLLLFHQELSRPHFQSANCCILVQFSLLAFLFKSLVLFRTIDLTVSLIQLLFQPPKLNLVFAH